MVSITILMMLTIEGMQRISTVLLVGAGVFGILAVVLFIRFDIRKIWGLLVRHNPQSNGQRMRNYAELISTDNRNMEEKQPDNKERNTQLLEREIRETQYLHTKVRDTLFLETPSPNTLPLKKQEKNIHILQEQTFIHTDISIN